MYAYYGSIEQPPAVSCPSGTTAPTAVGQHGLVKSATSPAPASGSAIVRHSVYDALGRVVAGRISTDTTWTCTAFDARGRTTKVAFPSNTTAVARTVSYSYSDAGTNDPRKTSVGDQFGTITTEVDLLGRVVKYTDAIGQVTTTVYDQAGRSTSTTGPGGVSEFVYDRAGKLTTQKLDTVTVATPSYVLGAVGGELSSVAYGNTTAMDTIVRDNTGNTTTLAFKQAATTFATDTVTRSQAGRILTSVNDGTTFTYGYDTVGRLTSAAFGANTYTYEFGGSGGCGANPAAGKNSNRTGWKNGAATIASYCYDNADRLTSTTAVGYTGTIGYDAHGNTTGLAGQTLGYDHADRHVTTVAPAATVAPGFRSQASNQVSGSSVVVTKPAGVVEGDVLVAVVAVNVNAGSAVSVTPPSGWTAIATRAHTTAAVRVQTWWKAATGNEPTSYSFSSSVSVKMAGGVAAFTGVNTASPIDVFATAQSAAATSSHVARSGDNHWASAVEAGDRGDQYQLGVHCCDRLHRTHRSGDDRDQRGDRRIGFVCAGCCGVNLNGGSSFGVGARRDDDDRAATGGLCNAILACV